MKLLQNLLVAILAIFLCSSFSFAQTSDLELTLQISDTTPDEGQIIEFEYVVENLGPDNASNIQVDDLLPTGFIYDSDDSGGLYNSGLDILNLAALNDGAKFTLKLNAYANTGTNGTVLTALGSITSLDQIDPDSSNDSVNLDITINYPDLEVTKTVDEPNPDEGMTIEYTITVEHLNTTNLSATNILIEDILSSDLTYVSDDSGGNYDSITGIWTVGTLTAGQDSTITITAIVNSGTSGKSIGNIARVLSFDQNDLNTANDQSNALINVTTADLTITKTVDDSAPDELQLVEFTIQISNNGPSFANNIMALDLLPSGLTYVSDDGGGSYNNATGIWTVGNLNDGDNIQINIQATVDAGTAAQTLTNNASITSFDQVDDNYGDNTSSADLFVNGADLAVTKTVSDTNPAVNDVITYTIVVTNNGPLKANDITIEDILAPQLNFQSSNETQGNPYDSVLGQWFVNDLNSGASATLTIDVQVDPSANGLLISNTASVFSVIEDDSITSNNSDSVDIGVGSADLEVLKSVNVATQSEGGTIIYTIQVTNNSLTTNAYATEVLDLLPTGIIYVSDDSATSSTTYDPVTGIWDAGTLGISTSKTLNITCTVDSGTGGSTIINSATGSSIMEDLNPANDADSASFQVEGADIEVLKTVDNDFPAELDFITYTITVTNNGPNNTTGVVVNDLIPFNITYDSHTPSQGTFDYITGDWVIGNLNNGATVTLDITAQVRISGAFTNTAMVTSSSEPDSITSNNSGSIRVSAAENFAAGAAIIDMGVTPQTYNSGLIPYGLVYELAINNNIPIYWVVNHQKSWVDPNAKQDQIDITVNGKDYKGGPFVVPAEFMGIATPIINTWVTNYPGLTVDSGLPAFTAPIYDYITSFPRAVLDDQNGDKVQNAFYDRANVPITFGRLGSPDDLTLCDDLYTMPHADPQNWDPSTVNNLIDFIENGGYFWSACHAVSAMEGLVDIDSDGNPDLNMLSNNGLIPWGSHGNGTPAYSYNTDISILTGSETAGDPLMQFMTTMDGALQNGSEQIYIPDTEGWRDTTVLAITDEDHPEVLDGTYPPGPAAALAYGRAFGDSSNGIVMYEGSHSIAGGSEEENVAAARAYGNFLLQAGIERRPQIKMDLVPVYNPNDDSITFNGDVSGIAPPFTYEWQDNCGGSFDDTSLLNATYTPDDTVEAQTCLLTLIVTDNCGRRNFTSFPVFFEIDIDGDNITKTIDLDDDNDGIPDVVEENGDPLRDTDGDGILDSSDLDSDNDGILDILEGGLTNAQIASYDTNNDGFIDNTYVFGLNGLIDDYEISPESGTVDYDGNGFQDDFANSDSDGSYNFQDIDADNDGIPDNVEAQTTAGYTAPATTSNKLGLNISYLSGLTLEDTDFDGTPDYLDSDADGDGTPDIEENGMANVLANLDSDSDGLDDAFEGSNTNDVDVNDEIDTPNTSILPDTDGDMALGGDLDYRDAIDEYYPSATLDFDGIDDHVGTSSFMTGYQDATIMAWIKLDPTFSTNGDVAGQSMFRMFINGGNRKLQSYIITNQNNSAYGTSSTEALTLNQWYHVAMSYTGATGALKMYINGNLDKQVTIPAGTLSTNATYTSHDFNIGRHSRLNNYFFKGCIDEVRVFDTVLTDHQLQQVVYQEIEQNGANVKGTIINKDIADLDSSATLPWNNLQGYFPMTNVFTNKTSDHSGKGRDANLYNITTVQRQTAPMPYETVSDGAWDAEATWLYGDVWDIEDVQSNEDWSIAHIKHDITTDGSHSNLGLFIDSGKTLSVTGDNAITNSLYLQLDGTIDLAADSQLVQGDKSDLVTSATGKILRRQEGNADKFWYNYWSAPVGSLSATSLSDNNGPTNNTNNTPFNLDMLKDGLGTDLQFTTAYHDLGKISNRWLYCFQNGITYYDWIAINEGSSLSPGIGYTQKGTGIGATEQQYIFEGKPNNGTILLPADDVDGDGANESIEGSTLTTTLIGNPYPSALDARQFITDNAGIIQGTILLWEQWAGDTHWLSEYEGGYGFINNFTTARAYQYPGINLADPSGLTPGIKVPSFYLPVGQGFFVEVVTDLGNIEFNNGQRVFIKEADADGLDPENGSTFFRNAQPDAEAENTQDDFQLIRMEFSTSNGASRRFVLGFGEDTTDAFDYGMDGGLITTPPSDDMGSLLNDGQYVIQAFSPITEDKEIDLVFHSSGSHNYSIGAVDIKNIPEYQKIYLKDNFNGYYHDLRNDSAYEFTSEAGTFDNRFQVVFREGSTLSNNDDQLLNALVFVNNQEEKLFVKGLDQKVKNLLLTNTIGQVIKRFKDIENNTLINGISTSDLSSGLYLVNIETENNHSLVKKVIIE